MKWADDLVAFLKFWNNNSSQIVERAWIALRGRKGFTYLFLVDSCRDVIDCDVELH